MNWNEYGECQGQMTIFDFLDHTSGSGKTSAEPCLREPRKEKTSGAYSKKSRTSSRPMFQSLCLKTTNGQMPDVWMETDGASHGASEMQLTKECHRDVEESFLWQILEDTVQPKYFLSERACLGILRRSEKRGKTLPEVLKNALLSQANISEQGLADLLAQESQ